MDPLVRAYQDEGRKPTQEELAESKKWVRKAFWENEILVTGFGLCYYVLPALLL